MAQKTCDGEPYLRCAARRATKRRGGEDRAAPVPSTSLRAGGMTIGGGVAGEKAAPRRRTPNGVVGPEIHESHLSSWHSSLRGVRGVLDYCSADRGSSGYFRGRGALRARLAALLRHAESTDGRRHRL